MPRTAPTPRTVTDLAVAKINEKGGIDIAGKNYKLGVRYYDDESTPARGTELAERLIQQDDVKFMLGPYSSGLTKAILPVVEKHKVPMVEANGASRELFTKGYRYLFAVLSTSDNISRRRSILPPSMPTSSARARTSSRSPSSWRMTRSRRTSVLACSMTSSVKACGA